MWMMHHVSNYANAGCALCDRFFGSKNKCFSSCALWLMSNVSTPRCKHAFEFCIDQHRMHVQCVHSKVPACVRILHLPASYARSFVCLSFLFLFVRVVCVLQSSASSPLCSRASPRSSRHSLSLSQCLDSVLLVRCPRRGHSGYIACMFIIMASLLYISCQMWLVIFIQLSLPLFSLAHFSISRTYIGNTFASTQNTLATPFVF